METILVPPEAAPTWTCRLRRRLAAGVVVDAASMAAFTVRPSVITLRIGAFESHAQRASSGSGASGPRAHLLLSLAPMPVGLGQLRVRQILRVVRSA